MPPKITPLKEIIKRKRINIIIRRKRIHYQKEKKRTRKEEEEEEEDKRRGKEEIEEEEEEEEQEEDDLLPTFLRLLDNIKDEHPMFGKPKPGMVKMPRKSHGRKNAQCWENTMKNIADRIYRVSGQVKFGQNRCWMVTEDSVNISKGKKPRIYRILAFLLNPTNENWNKVQDTESGGNIRHPFCHTCNRGQKKKEQDKKNCVNGLEHGFFGTRKINESFKLCTNGCRARCPGHGPDRFQCIFTTPKGHLIPCLMTPDHLPRCQHNPRCYTPL